MFALRFLNAQSYFSLTRLPTTFVNYLIFVTSIFSYFKSSCIMNKIRSYDLDNLKVFLTVMVIFHHAGQAYGDGGDWPYHPSNPAEYMPEIWRFFSTNAAYLMGLFFLISGYFVPISFDKQGFATFLRKKCVRLGIPLVIVTILLTLMVGKLELGTMWFVETLLCFCLIYGALRCCGIRLSETPRLSWSLGTLVEMALLMGVGSHLIRQVSPQDHWIWLLGVIRLEPAHYLQYMFMFSFGVLLSRWKGLGPLTDRTGALSLGIGLVFVLLNVCRTGELHDFIQTYFGLFESFLCVFLSVGLLWLFRKVAHGSNGFLRWCSGQAYGAYVFHLFILVALQQLMDGLVLDVHAKFLLLGLLATLLSFGFTWLLKLLPGVKRVL